MRTHDDGAMERVRWIEVEALAPPKPPLGAACNGCGLCCLAEPCPLGMLLSRRRQGRCRMLQWSAAEQRYRCGAMSGGGRLRRWLAARWIAAGAGCDATIEPRR
jgi:hypothetical protein